MRRAILDEPAVHEARVVLPAHLVTVIERHERPLERRQAIERHPGEVVVLDVIVRVEKREIPEPVPPHERAPLRGIARIDVVVLSEPVQRERDREDEEDRDNVRAHGRGAARGRPDQREHRQVRDERDAALEHDAPLERGGIGRAFLPRGPEVDRKQRRRTVQQLEPPRVGLRRQMMTLGIVLVGTELPVMIEVPARELARRDTARHRIQPPQRYLGEIPLGTAYNHPSAPSAAGRRRSKIVWCTTSCRSTVKLNTVKPCTSASGTHTIGLAIEISPQVASARIANWRAAISRWRAALFVWSACSTSRDNSRPSSVRSAAACWL